MTMNEPTRIRVIDSHTGGEPTRVVVEGFPALAGQTLEEKLADFRRRFDHLRRAMVREPRGFDAIVGALLCEPVDPLSAAGVIFFNNVGFLGMCGHGTIGLVRTLQHMGRLSSGTHRIETAVGTVTADLHPDGTVSITNVPSYRTAKDVEVEIEGRRIIRGDIAYGGNWFFLVSDHGEVIEMSNLSRLTELSARIRTALRERGITGDDGAEIDHVELFGPSEAADSRNFVLCPGIEYDRSPCGTGTSAKLACLYTDGKLTEGGLWRQESIVGSIFEGKIAVSNGRLIPTITGSAFVTGETDLILDPADPLRFGVS